MAGAVALLAAMAFGHTAGATSICGKIRMELNSATETIGNTRETRAYQQAISSQQREIGKVQRDLRRFGCTTGSFLVFGGENAQTCDMLSATLDRMYDNLAALQDHDIPLVSKSMSPSRRGRLLDDLERNGCNDVPDSPRAARDTAPAEPASYGLDNRPLQDDRMPPGSQQSQIRNLGGGDRGGNLQTVCVRTCDGGFFPVSSNTSPASFERDAQVCSMMCPGVQTELFYHGVGTQEMVDMVSASGGTPYKEEPYAFRFRTSARKDKSCSCNFSAYYRDMMKREAGKTDGTEAPGQNRSSTDPAPQEPYSSIVNLDTRPDVKSPAQAPAPAPKAPAVAEKSPQPGPAKPYDPAKDKVRQVGPQFLPGKDTAIDLRHPKDTTAN
jgi:hypothetical protein